MNGSTADPPQPKGPVPEGRLRGLPSEPAPQSKRPRLPETIRRATYDGTLPGRCPACGARVWLFSERLFGDSWVHQWIDSSGLEHTCP